MALENARKFLEQVMKDKALRARTAEKEPAEVVAIAKELGFDVTAEELEEAVKAMRKTAGEATKELSIDELGKVAGGIFWTGEDAPDGHEMGCFMTYHHRQWCADNNIWCKSTFYCTGSYTSDDPDWSGDN